ncbi:MAG: YidC/Oxa1 family membrane protein insertase [bacterium]|nr:YidC/Oxa1 family membrane protein insertase [bacterium]
MIAIYNLIFYQPIFNLLIFFYNIIPGHDVGVAIIVLTFLARLILFPFTLQSLRSQKAMQALQPKMNELKEKYKNEKDKLARATMELYKQEKVNPLSSCLPLLVQLPIFIALYQAMMAGLEGKNLEMLYGFVTRPETVNVIAFGFLNLSKPNFVLALLAGLAQFVQSKGLIITKQPKVPGAKDEAMLSMMNKQMVYLMPIMTVVIGASFPGGLTLYWLVTNVLTLLQQKLFLKNKPVKTVLVQVVKN